MNIEFRSSFIPAETKNKLKLKLKKHRQDSKSTSTSPSLLLKDENYSVLSSDVAGDIGRSFSKQFLSSYSVGQESMNYNGLKGRSYSLPNFSLYPHEDDNRVSGRSSGDDHCVSYSLQHELLPPLPSDDDKSLSIGSSIKESITEDDDEEDYINRLNNEQLNHPEEDTVDRMANKILNVVSVTENSSKHFEWGIWCLSCEWVYKIFTFMY